MVEVEDWQAPPPSVDPNIPASTAPNSNSGGVDGSIVGSISSVGGTEVESTPVEVVPETGEGTTTVTTEITIRNEAGRFRNYRRSSDISITSIFSDFGLINDHLRMESPDSSFSRRICVAGGCKRALRSNARVDYDFPESLRIRKEDINVASGPLEDWTVSRYGRASTGPNGNHWHEIEQTRNIDENGHPMGPFINKNVYKPVDRWNVAANQFGDSDFLTFGYWLDYNMVEDTRSSRWLARPDQIRYLVFADSQTTQVNVSALDGTATYSGQSTGVMQWNEDGSRRVSTFEKAPVIFTADFADNSINGEVFLDHNGGPPSISSPVVRTGGDGSVIGINRNFLSFVKSGGNFYQYPDGVDPAQTGSDLSGWHEIAPGRIHFLGGKINDEGTFSFSTSGVTDGFVRVVDNPSRSGTPVDADQGSSYASGRFIRPQANVPQWMQGVFVAESVGDRNSGSFYKIEGAFGAKK